MNKADLNVYAVFYISRPWNDAFKIHAFTKCRTIHKEDTIYQKVVFNENNSFV